MIVFPPDEAFHLPWWMAFPLGWLAADAVLLYLNHRRKVKR